MDCIHAPGPVRWAAPSTSGLGAPLTVLIVYSVSRRMVPALTSPAATRTFTCRAQPDMAARMLRDGSAAQLRTAGPARASSVQRTRV